MLRHGAHIAQQTIQRTGSEDHRSPGKTVELVNRLAAGPVCVNVSDTVAARIHRRRPLTAQQELPHSGSLFVQIASGRADHCLRLCDAGLHMAFFYQRMARDEFISFYYRSGGRATYQFDSGIERGTGDAEWNCAEFSSDKPRKRIKWVTSQRLE